MRRKEKNHVNDTLKIFHDEVGFELLTAVTVKSSVFRDLTPCI
jgi:hypothetical protein